MTSDTYYCGHCRRYQRAVQGKICVGCSRQTVIVGQIFVNGKYRQETPHELDIRWKKFYG